MVSSKGVMLTWAHAETDWRPYLNEINKTLLSLAKAIAKYEKVLVVAQQKEEVLQMLYDELGPQLMQNVTVVECKTNDTWARDHGFITLLEKQNEGSVQPVYMDFSSMAGERSSNRNMITLSINIFATTIL